MNLQGSRTNSVRHQASTQKKNTVTNPKYAVPNIKNTILIIIIIRVASNCEVGILELYPSISNNASLHLESVSIHIKQCQSTFRKYTLWALVATPAHSALDALNWGCNSRRQKHTYQYTTNIQMEKQRLGVFTIFAVATYVLPLYTVLNLHTVFCTG